VESSFALIVENKSSFLNTKVDLLFVKQKPKGADLVFVGQKGIQLVFFYHGIFHTKRRCL